MFFDNCTSPVLAAVLHGLLAAAGDAARHVRDMDDYGLQGDTPDDKWIACLGDDRPADWTVITGDKRITKNKALRAAWIRAGLKGFVLAPAVLKSPVHRQASLLLWRWPDVRAQFELSAKGSMFELPIQRSAGFRPLAVT